MRSSRAPSTLTRRLVGVAALALAVATDAWAQPTATFESLTRLPRGIEALTHLLESRDPANFLRERAKPLDLSKVQRDSLKKLEQGLERIRRPMLKRLDEELPESRLPGQQVEISTLPTVTRALVDSIRRTTERYGEWAWGQLGEAQLAQALELRAQWTPDEYVPTQTRKAYRVTRMGPP